MNRKKMPTRSSIGSHHTSTCGQMLDSSFDFTEYGMPASRISLVSLPGNSAYDHLLGRVGVLARDDVAGVVVTARLDRDLLDLARRLPCSRAGPGTSVTSSSFSLLEESVNIE